MGKIKPYKEQDSSKQTAQEPMMATYHNQPYRWTTLSTVFPEMLWLKPFYLP